MFGRSVKEALNDLAKFELLQVGSTGSGKTTRTLSATMFGPLYVFDLDGKIGGAARNLPDSVVDLVSYDNYKDQDFDAIFTKLKELKGLYDKGERPFSTIAVDTFTVLNEKAYIKAMGKKLDIKGSKATFDEWGIIGTDLLNFFNTLHSFPCNIIVNCHVARSENVEGKEVLGVEGMGSFRNRIAYKMSDANYLYFDQGKHFVRVKNSSAVPANSNVQPKFIDKVGNATVLDLSIFEDYAYRVTR